MQTVSGKSKPSPILASTLEEKHPTWTIQLHSFWYVSKLFFFCLSSFLWKQRLYYFSENKKKSYKILFNKVSISNVPRHIPNNEACHQWLAKQQQKVKLAFISSGFDSPGVYIKYNLILAVSSETATKQNNNEKKILKVFWENQKQPSRYRRKETKKKWLTVKP